MILPPIDPGWQTDDPGRSNIHRNKGTCEYDLYVVYSNGSEDVLATFYKDNQADSQYFQVKFTDGYFFDQPDTNPVLYGMAKHQSGYYLRTRQSRPDSGILYFRNENRPAGMQESEDFRIRIVQSSNTTIRPGDDIQLRFGVSGFREYDTAVPEGDFMAIYDHKLLWRANLFINENDFTITDCDNNATAMNSAPGEADWNDANPWIWGNSWNRIHRGTRDYITNYDVRYPVGNQSSTYCADNLRDLDFGNGGQVVNILPGTWPVDYDDDSTNRDIDGSVLYYWGASNSPFSYNDRIENWRQGLRAHFYEPMNPYNFLGNWAYTYAPWSGPNVQREGVHVWENYDYDNLTAIPAARQLSNVYYNAASCGYDYFPYEDERTIGVDCGGLVYLAASYIGNPYNFDGAGGDDICNGYRNWIDVGTDEDPNVPAREQGAVCDNLWFISRGGPNVQPQGLDRIIPGDIFYYWYYHVAIVQSVEYATNSRNITPNEIILIEATWDEDDNDYDDFGCVIKTRSIGRNYLQRNWIIGRLKTE